MAQGSEVSAAGATTQTLGVSAAEAAAIADCLEDEA